MPGALFRSSTSPEILQREKSYKALKILQREKSHNLSKKPHYINILMFALLQ